MTKKNYGHRRLPKFLSIVLFIVSLGICIFTADIFSSLITVGSFNFSTSSTKVTEYKVFAISLSKFSTHGLASEYSESVKKQNAAGYIWKHENYYHVLASAYEKENDAILVKDNLKTSGVESDIITLSFSELDLSIEDKIQKSVYVESIKTFKNIFLSLYDISVSLDTSVYNDTRCKIEITALESQIDKALENIKNNLSSENSMLYIILKVKLNYAKEVISDLVSSSVSTKLSSDIKYSYFKILKLNNELIDELTESKM